MSKKDFEAIAAVLREAKANKFESPCDVLDFIAAGIARHCQEGNPRFDRRRFLAAATIED
jgi:hypothetical protein